MNHSFQADADDLDDSNDDGHYYYKDCDDDNSEDDDDVDLLEYLFKRRREYNS